MKDVNLELERVLGRGNYCNKPYNSEAKLIGEYDYNHYIRCAAEEFVLHTQKGFFTCKVKEVDVKLFWNLLGDVPTNENGEIETTYEHFEVGTDTSDIWHWFEWYFDISIGTLFF